MFTLKAPSFTASVCPRQVGEQRGRWVFGVDMNAEKRFWDKVDKSGDCWDWRGAVTDRGYGHFWDGNKKVRSHRFVYTLLMGFIPDGMYVCHHCDNPGCVKPSHLFLGTQRDNIQDSIAKGRFKFVFGTYVLDTKGENNGNSRLCENDVHEIRRLCSLGVKRTLVAKMWRISRRHVKSIVLRTRWKHI